MTTQYEVSYHLIITFEHTTINHRNNVMVLTQKYIEDKELQNLQKAHGTSNNMLKIHLQGQAHLHARTNIIMNKHNYTHFMQKTTRKHSMNK